MQLFKRILPPAELPPDTPERRRSPRFAVNPEFPLQVRLAVVWRDEQGEAMGDEKAGWLWKGRLVDCSEDGARIRFPGEVYAGPGDACDLRLALEDFELEVPCTISNLRHEGGGAVFGLRHTIHDERTWHAYAQFLEVISFGATLRPQFKKPQWHSGYLMEQYAGERQSCLNVWRQRANKAVAPFEFRLRESIVRAALGQELEYYTGEEIAAARRASEARTAEIHRLFRWVVPNLAPVVPQDVRKFLRRYTGS